MEVEADYKSRLKKRKEEINALKIVELEEVKLGSRRHCYLQVEEKALNPSGRCFHVSVMTTVPFKFSATGSNLRQYQFFHKKLCKYWYITGLTTGLTLRWVQCDFSIILYA